MLFISIFPYEKLFTSIALVIYWLYFLLKQLLKQSNKLSEIYQSSTASFTRGILLSIGFTSYLLILNKEGINSEAVDSLWLLYLFVTMITSLKGKTSQTVILVVMSVFGLFITSIPLEIIASKGDVSIAFKIFLSRALWISLLAFLLHSIIRYLGDYTADLEMIYKVQVELNQCEEKIINSEIINDFPENLVLQIAVEKIAESYRFPHVLIFYKGKDEEINLVAGSSPEGKELLKSEFKLNPSKSIISHVINSSATYYSNNVKYDNYYFPHTCFPKTKSELAIPIIENNNVLGCLDIQTNKYNSFQEHEIKVNEIIVGNLCNTIHNIKVTTEKKRLNQVINGIATSIFSKNELYETLEEIAKITHNELNADITIIYGRDPKLNSIIGPIVEGKLRVPSELTNEINEDSVVKKLFNLNEKVFIHKNLDEINRNPLFLPSSLHIKNNKPTFISREGIYSNVIIRLTNQNECIGLLFVNYRRALDISDERIEFIRSFASLAEIAIQKEQLHSYRFQLEKNKYAMFAHDFLISESYGLSQYVRGLINDKNRSDSNIKELQIIQASVSRISKDIQWIQTGITDSLSGNLFADIDRNVNYLREYFNVNISNQWKGPVPIFSDQLSINYIMILNEAIRNAIRHGKATSISVEVVVEEGSIEMRVSDNGIGIKENVPQGNGLRNMKDRIESIGGNLTIESNLEQGTRISINAPIEWQYRRPDHE